MALQDRPGLAAGPLDHVAGAGLGPFLRTAAVADLRVDVLHLHQAQGLLMAEEMARPLGADLAHGLDREAVLGHLDAADRAQDRADHVVVDHQALETEAEQAGMHAGRLVDQVGPGKSEQGLGVTLLVAGLGVRQLRIGHSRGDARGQVVELPHLGAGGGEQPLLAAAPAHCAGAQIRDEGPGPEDRRRALRDGVDVDQAAQHLGDLLDHSAGQGRRRGGAGLSGGEQQDRHAAAHRRLEAAAGVLDEGHRRHHEAAGHGNEGPGTPLVLAAGDGMQHGQRLLDVRRLDEAGADVLAGSRDGGVAGIEVEVARRGHVPGDDRALEEMDVLQRVGQPRHVVEVPEGRFAIGAGLGIDDVDRRAGGAEVDPRAAELHVERGIGRVQDDVPCRLCQGVLDQGARDHQAPLVAQPRPGRGQHLDTAGNRIGETDLLKHVEGGGVDPPHLGRRQGPVAAPGQARPGQAGPAGRPPESGPRAALAARHGRRAGGKRPRLPPSPPPERTGRVSAPWSVRTTRAVSSILRSVNTFLFAPS